MAHIETSYISHGAVLALERKDLEIILPILKSRLKIERKLYKKYEDIHESGESTNREQTLMVKHQNRMKYLDIMIYQAEQFFR